MCVRTKFSYGCGHTFRHTEDCNSPDCSGLDKYLITRDGDCKPCKRDGSGSVRGRNGHGRYAKEIRLRERSQSVGNQQRSASASTESVLRHSTTGPSSSDEAIGAWAESSIHERAWESPHRRKADDAWLSEHESRMSDLHGRLQKVQLSSRHGPPHSLRQRVYEVEDEDEDQDGEEDEEAEAEDREPEEEYRVSVDPEYSMDDERDRPNCAIQVRRRVDDTPSRYSHSRSTQSYHPQVTQYSYDSLPDSMPSYRSSPRHRTQSTMRYAQAEPQYEYDYYTGYSTPRKVAKRSSERANTETYSHSRSNSGYGYDYDYQYAHPVVLDNSCSRSSPRYYLPQRSSGNRYRPHDHGQMIPSYARYQPRY